MLTFVFAAVAAYLVFRLGAPVAVELRRSLLIKDYRSLRPWRETLIDAAPSGLALVVYLFVVARFADFGFLESVSNLRLVFGTAFGALLWLLVPGSPLLQRPPRDAAGAPGERVPPPDRPRWLRTPTLVAAALVVLPVLTLIAPHGELDFRILRSVKTPIVEAQFAQQAAEFRFDLESEPQGFFRLGVAGLADALYMPYFELLYQTEVAGTSSETQQRAGDFIVSVLQPSARCIHAIDAHYGDRELLVELLGEVGTGLARASLVATAPSAVGAATVEGTALAPEVREAVVAAELRKAFATVARAARRQLPSFLLATEQGASPPAHPCTWYGGSLAAELRGLEGELTAIMHEPAIAHAGAMFFFWAGNPRAALRLVETVEAGADTRAARRALAEYPALYQIRGFAQRWVADRATDPRGYLQEWAIGIDKLEQRLDAIGAHPSSPLRQCGRASATPDVVRESEIRSLLRSPHPPVFENEEETVRQLRRTYGYFSYAVFKLRNHLVYESARELLTGRWFASRSHVLAAGRGHALRLLNQVDGDALGAGGCFAQLEVAFDAGELDHLGGADAAPERAAITLVRPEHEYAVALDSFGNMALAEAYFDTHLDEAEAELAVRTFQRALRIGAQAGVSEKMTAIIRNHRDQARTALGLPPP